MTTPYVRYQVFVSSTYEDLREERQQATQAILEAGSFPSGMELFPASDETQWDLIKRVIEESDYYIVIVGGRYGTIGPAGKSYTEMEYDFAVESGVPVLGFIKTNIDDLPAKYVETNPDTRKLLDQFRDKVKSRTCRMFNDPRELGMAVIKSVMHEARVRPRTGWVKASEAQSEEDRRREARLRDDLDDAQSHIKFLERELRDRSVLVDEIPRENLAQGDDTFEFEVSFRNENKEFVSQKVPVTWNDIFRVIGPSLYGYILRKGNNTYSQKIPVYPFQENIEQFIRAKIIDRAQNRKIDILEGQVDTCVFQLKELGLIKFEEKKESDGSVFRGVTLTEFGERSLSRLKTELR